MDPHLYEGRVLNIDGVDQEVPKFSRWKRIAKICCFNIAYFPDIKKYFVNQWECNCFFPSIFITFFLCSFAFSIWSVIETLKGTKFTVFVTIYAIVFALFVASYFLSMCLSPGYLPFYWAVERRQKYTYEEHMDGIITNDEQFNFANRNERPPRGSLSKQGRRLILRADHVCKWASNWVGLKNFRFYYMMLVWLFASFCFFWAAVGLGIASVVSTGRVTAALIALAVVCLPDLVFFAFAARDLVRHTVFLLTNDTAYAAAKRARERDRTNYYDVGCARNIEQALGPCAFCPLYLLPVPLPREADGFAWESAAGPAPPPELDPGVSAAAVAAAPTLEEYLSAHGRGTTALEVDGGALEMDDPIEISMDSGAPGTTELDEAGGAGLMEGRRDAIGFA